jgi:Fe-S cluster assembly scaffold protein SufB
MKPGCVVSETLDRLLEVSDIHPDVLNDPGIAHLFIHNNKVIGLKGLPGLTVVPEEMPDGVSLDIRLAPGTVIEKPVHLCFGVLPKEGVQRIVLRVEIGDGASIGVLAHCAFPDAVNVTHLMDGEIILRPGAVYAYRERHIHGSTGGIRVVPKARVRAEADAVFRTDFELLKGRVGKLEIDYETVCLDRAVMEMNARVNARGDDFVKIVESGFLEGEGSRGALTTRVALRDDSIAEVTSRIVASAAGARGHVDCKEILQDRGRASAVPVVDVRHPKAHVTHEAAIGSVDSRQMQTLMARGLTEDEAVELIIKGLLR